MEISNKIRVLSTSFLLGVITIFASNSYGLSVGEYTLPGIIPSGLPAFETPVKVSRRSTSTGFYMTAIENGTDSTLWKDDTTSYAISQTDYTLKALEASGEVNGYVKIRGMSTDLGVNARSTLFAATLTGDWATDGQLFGFNTDIVFCHAVIKEWCTESESVYLSLDEAIDVALTRTITPGSAITTIPIPAAVWLFGSGILGLLMVARRSKV